MTEDTDTDTDKNENEQRRKRQAANATDDDLPDIDFHYDFEDFGSQFDTDFGVEDFSSDPDFEPSIDLPAGTDSFRLIHSLAFVTQSIEFVC